MKTEQIQNTLKFLERTQLQAVEIPAFMACVTALQTLAKSLEKKEQDNASE